MERLELEGFNSNGDRMRGGRGCHRSTYELTTATGVARFFRNPTRSLVAMLSYATHIFGRLMEVLGQSRAGMNV